jgi:hypothetical protein
LALVLKNNYDSKKIFLLLFSLVFIVFLFTSDGHRYTQDEFFAQEMSLRMVTFEPHPDYVEGESKMFFNLPIQNPYNAGSVCSNAITCFPGSIFYSFTQVPFIALNYYFPMITSDTVVFSMDDFADAHYVFWRNSENSNFIFLELFYAPFFLALSIGIFFLICLEHKFNRQNSIILSFLLAFSTIIWAYSSTSLNSIPACFFLLLGYLFFKKFYNLNQYRFLIFSSFSLGFAFVIRHDVIFFVVPMFFFVIANILKRKSKIYSLLIYSTPLVFFYAVNIFTNKLRTIPSSSSNEIVPLSQNSSDLISILINHFSSFFLYSSISHILTASFGLLFAPGLGLLIFSPILLTVFFSFIDFFRKNKSECLLLLSFFIVNLLYHADLGHWHGFVSWSARYLLLLVPFLLIPLGASLEQRNKKFILSIILILGILGVLFNLSYLVQDVHWFVWSTPGSSTGLFGLGLPSYGQFALWLNDVVFWTFQYSQLTHSILLMFEGLQHDIYLLHLLGNSMYSIILISTLSSLSYLFWRIYKKNIVLTKF